MTQPPPATVGSQPADALSVNLMVGQHLRQFLANKNAIDQDTDFLQATDLKVAPYYFTADQETLLKSAVFTLHTSFDAIDMTFISRVIGLGV